MNISDPTVVKFSSKVRKYGSGIRLKNKNEPSSPTLKAEFIKIRLNL